MRLSVGNAVLQLQCLSAFSDNYIWLLHDGLSACVVDPGDATPVFAALRSQQLSLKNILLTHHHADHTHGVPELVRWSGATVYGPMHEVLPEPVIRVAHGDSVSVLGNDFEVLSVPGHTAGHVAYFGSQGPNGPLLFPGDTLFSGGCGRLFEGTPAQMLASLDRLSQLPAETCICCAHEYTLSNLRFALAVDPENAQLQAYVTECETLRALGRPTLPCRLDMERRINPFLRSRDAGVRAGLSSMIPLLPDDDVAVFAALRELKDNFR